MQHVKIPNGNVNGKRAKYVNFILHITQNSCVVTNITAYDDIPCFGYALVISIMLKEMHIDGDRTFCENKLDVMEQVRELFDAAHVTCGPVNL